MDDSGMDRNAFVHGDGDGLCHDGEVVECQAGADPDGRVEIHAWPRHAGFLLDVAWDVEV